MVRHFSFRYSRKWSLQQKHNSLVNLYFRPTSPTGTTTNPTTLWTVRIVSSPLTSRNGTISTVARQENLFVSLIKTSVLLMRHRSCDCWFIIFKKDINKVTEWQVRDSQCFTSCFQDFSWLTIVQVLVIKQFRRQIALMKDSLWCKRWKWEFETDNCLVSFPHSTDLYMIWPELKSLEIILNSTQTNLLDPPWSTVKGFVKFGPQSGPERKKFKGNINNANSNLTWSGQKEHYKWVLQDPL